MWFRCCLASLLPVLVLAQAPGVPVYREGPGSHAQASLREQAKALRQKKALLTMADVAAQTKRSSCKLELPAPDTTKLDNRELWHRARQAHIRVGWYYMCNDCQKWHLELSGGYAITKSAVATCGHVVGDGQEEDMREGYLVAADEDDHLIPVVEVLAINAATDSAILRLQTDKLQPLPLGKDVVPGDPIVCFNDPLERRGVYSTGVVSRFMQRPFLRKEEMTEEQRANPHMLEVPVFVQVTADWAPGSSGSAVIDRCGNAIGHVSEVQTELEESDDIVTDAKQPESDEPQPLGTVIVFHDAIAASNVQALIKPEAKPQ